MKKLVFILSEQGNSGKSYIASNIIDQLRINGNQTAGYLLDNEQVAVLNRLGSRNEDGILDLHQNPLTGIFTYDLLNQKNMAKADHEKELANFLGSFSNEADISAYDFPGQGRSALKKLFLQDEFEYALDLSDKEIIVVVPVIERKSLVSLQGIFDAFNFTGDWEFLNDRIKFVVLFNPIKDTNIDLTPKDFIASDIHKKLRTLEGRYGYFELANVNSKVIDAVKNAPFSHYFDTKIMRTINLTDEMKDSLGIVDSNGSTFNIHLRRVLANNTGFIKITKQIFNGEAFKQAIEPEAKQGE